MLLTIQMPESLLTEIPSKSSIECAFRLHFLTVPHGEIFRTLQSTCCRMPLTAQLDPETQSIGDCRGNARRVQPMLTAQVVLRAHLR